MRFVVAVIVFAITAVIFSNANAQERACTPVSVKTATYSASYMEACGSELRAFALRLHDFKRTVENGAGPHMQGFTFVCAVEPLCEGEPTHIRGFFIAPEVWDKTSKNAKAILDFWLRDDVRVGRVSSSLPSQICPIFDVLVGGITGLVADEQAGFSLNFHQPNQFAT